MMRQFLAPLFISLMIITGCGDDSTDIELNIRLTYGDDPVVMFDEIAYPDGTRMRITDVKGFFSSISILSDNTETLVEEVAFVEIGDKHSDAEEAAVGYSLILEETGLTDIDGIRFNIGLTESQNSTVPVDYTSSSVLSKSSEYWPNWESYVFFKIEGNADFNGNGSYDSGENIVLHLGSNDALRLVTLDTQGEDGTIRLNLDLRKVFEFGDGLYDLEAMPTIHATLTDAVLANINLLSDNVSNAFSVAE